MKTKHRLTNEKLNIFKLLIYDWNIEKAVKYYLQDDFCIDHFLTECNMSDQHCLFNHKYYFFTLWNNQYYMDFLKMMCEYLLYTNKRPNSGRLYCFYAHTLRIKILTKQDGLRCEQYYLKAIELDPKFGDSHSGYAQLLRLQRYHMYDYEKATKYAEIACNIDSDPNVHVYCQNYCRILYSDAETDADYKKALHFAQKALKFSKNEVIACKIAGLSLAHLMRYQESIEYFERGFNISNAYEPRALSTTVYIGIKMYLLVEKWVKQQQEIIAKENKKEKEKENDKQLEQQQMEIKLETKTERDVSMGKT